MALLAYNLTTSPLTLAAGSPAVVLPPSGTVGARSLSPVNVTGDFSVLAPSDFAALDAQRAAGLVSFQWTTYPEFSTSSLLVGVRTQANDAVSSPTYWIDAVNGLDSNDGLSSGSAFKTIKGFYDISPSVWVDGAKPIVNFMSSPSGSAASIVSGADAGNVRISGLTGMSGSDLGGSIQIAKAATAANNGIFPIVKVVNATTVDVFAASAVAGDANNGAIYWDKAHIVRSFVWYGGERSIPGVRWRGPDVMSAFPTQTGPSTAALDVAPITELSLANAAGVTVPCRTQLNFTTASPGWTVDDMSGRAFVRVTRSGSKQYFELPIARNTANTLIIDTLLYRTSGLAASISNAGVVTGLTGMTAGDVGNKLVLIGAATSGNNGAFTITAFNSATSVTVSGAGGTTDANNGSLQWFDLPFDRILATDTIEIVKPDARINGPTDAYNSGQLFIGGNSSANTSITTQSPNIGHGFEMLSLIGTGISSHAIIDRGFDRCIIQSALLVNGQFSYNNCASRGGNHSINTATNPPSVGGSRPDGPITFLTTSITSGATTATLVDPTGWAASGKLKIDNEVMTYTLSGSTLTLTRAVDGTNAAAHNALVFVYQVSSPINPAPQVMLALYQGFFTNMLTNPTKPFGTSMQNIHRPLSMWQSRPGTAGIQGAITFCGGATYLTQDRGQAILGDVDNTNSPNRPFIRAKVGCQVLLDPYQFFAVGGGTAKTLQLETGAAIDIGAGVGQFMEPNGFNGNFTRWGSDVVKKSVTQSAADSIADITAATGGGPPIKALRAMAVTAGASGFLGTYILAPVGTTTVTAGGNLAVGIATISDDGKTITFPVGTQATAVTLEYEPTVATGDASRIAQQAL